MPSVPSLTSNVLPRSAETDGLVVELHAPAAAHHHVHLLLPLVRVAVREAIVGRDALEAQAGLL